MQDVEDESVDVKKTTKGSKRSRAAEVHNLSERVSVRRAFVFDFLSWGTNGHSQTTKVLIFLAVFLPVVHMGR